MSISLLQRICYLACTQANEQRHNHFKTEDYKRNYLTKPVTELRQHENFIYTHIHTHKLRLQMIKTDNRQNTALTTFHSIKYQHK